MMVPECRLLVLDIDGTFLNRQKQVSPAVREAVLGVVSHGLPVAFATGRMFEAIEHWVAELGFTTPQICNNGAELVDPATGDRLSRRSLSVSTVRWLLEHNPGADFATVLFSGSRVLAAGRHPAHALLERNNEWVEVVPSEFLAGNDLQVEKLLYMTLDHCEALRTLRDDLNARAAHGEAVAFDAQISEEGILNFCHPQATKLNAIRQLCGRLGCDLDDVIAVGDGDNDAEILAAVGLGIAMGNASEAARQAARISVPDNDHDGLAAAVSEHVLPRISQGSLPR